MRAQPKCILVTIALAAICAAHAARAEGACPMPELPAMTQSLNRMTSAHRADDAMQCIIDIADDPSSDLFSDELRFALAKQSSVAIEALNSGGGTPFRPYQQRAAKLWLAYLKSATSSSDRTQLLTGITNVLNYARFDDFGGVAPTIVAAMGKARRWLGVDQANRFFSILNRCPAWLDEGAPERDLCRDGCSQVAGAVLEAFRSEFDADDWAGSEGVRRLKTNSGALKGRLQCTR